MRSFFVFFSRIIIRKSKKFIFNAENKVITALKRNFKNFKAPKRRLIFLIKRTHIK